jgi:hypothetical protein
MGFKILINGELAKELGGDDHRVVQSVALRSSQGEEGIFNVPNHIDTVDVIVELRDTLESNYLDIRPYTAGPVAEEIEKNSVDRVAEGRKLQQDLDAQARLENQQEQEAIIAAHGGPPEEEDARVTPEEASAVEEEATSETQTKKTGKVTV